MKKLLIALLVLCLGCVVLVGCLGAGDNQTAQEEAPAQETTAAETGDAVPEMTGGVDYDAIYALHEPDEVVLTVDGKEVIWEDYYYVYYNQATRLESQFQQYQSYGYAMGWESQADDEGHSYAELMGDAAEQNLRRVMTVEAVAEEEQIQLDNSDPDVQEEHQANIQGFCGEGGTEEQLFETIGAMHLRPELYWRLIKVNLLSHLVYDKCYGEEGEMLDDQQVMEWMEENELLSADHILISIQGLSEEEAAEKKELAEQLAAELLAIEDQEERLARFQELKEEHNEDPGAADGYVFGPGVMVQAFFDGTAALEVGQISEPVESEFGYHIILRRALSPEDKVTSSTGAQTARVMAASELFSKRMQDKLDSQKVEYAAGFEAPKILDYYTKPEYTA